MHRRQLESPKIISCLPPRQKGGQWPGLLISGENDQNAAPIVQIMADTLRHGFKRSFVSIRCHSASPLISGCCSSLQVPDNSGNHLVTVSLSPCSSSLTGRVLGKLQPLEGVRVINFGSGQVIFRNKNNKSEVFCWREC